MPSAQGIKEIVEGIFQELASPQKIRKRNLLENWPAIVGPKIASHTKPTFGRGGRLNVWVDQSALAFELKQKYEAVLLKRVQAVMGEEVVKALRFYVGQLR